jgi:1,4-alpha-glucan branching enzyme
MERLKLRQDAAGVFEKIHASQVQGKNVTTHPDVLLGRPVIAGTRVAVDEVLDRLANSNAPEALRKFLLHPGVTASEIEAALRFAAEAVRASSPIDKTDPLQLHGAHKVTIPERDGTLREAVAIRAFLPGAEGVALRQPPAPAKIMERVHPAGVYEALFPPGEEPSKYQFAVTLDGSTILTEDPYGIPPYTTRDSVTRQMPSAGEAGAVGPAEGLEPAPVENLNPGRLHEILGAHPIVHYGLAGVSFAVWAPNAASVSVVGDFNQWNGFCNPMRAVDSTGVWEVFVPGLAVGELYKYRITSRADRRPVDKADPFAFAAELRPRTASVIWDLGRYKWNDGEWLAGRERRQALDQPFAIYEVHLGSWRRRGATEGPGEWLTYRELAETLIPYVKDMGYTHIEPLPVAEHPYDGSWGYQTTGYFAPTSRYGTPDDFRYFVDKAHEAGLGVILDWVPGHFPTDEHGLSMFDGTHLFEHSDPRRRENREWGTSSFDLEREEVRNFLLTNAAFWLREYHIDGLRFDAVSAMVYLDYSRQHWVPNRFGGRENLEATSFLRSVNELIHREFPGVLAIAEESTAWPSVTSREKENSLGFDLKWNLGWMHDTIGYVQRDPVHRRHHHDNLTFSLLYAFSENFLLPFSHDEVVHGKRSMLSKMPGDDWQKFANLRSLYGYMYGHPGKKLHFMGAEFGQLTEWSENRALDWGLLDNESHRQLRDYVRDLNRLYVSRPALYERDFSWDGFQWIRCDDANQSVVSFLRRGKRPGDFVAVVANFTPVTRNAYRLGLPVAGSFREALNSDAAEYGGSGVRNSEPIVAEPISADDQPFSATVTLPPLAILFIDPLPGAVNEGSGRVDSPDTPASRNWDAAPQASQG